MNYLSLLALFGHLSAILARPEGGYNYAHPQQPLQLNQQQISSGYNYAQQQQPLQLNHQQISSSFQQSLPQFNQISQQIPSHHHSQSISQPSFPQFNPQSFQQQPSSQYGSPNFQSSQHAEITPQLSFQVPLGNQLHSSSAQFGGNLQNQFSQSSLQHSPQVSFQVPLGNQLHSSSAQFGGNLQNQLSQSSLQNSFAQTSPDFSNFASQSDLNQFSQGISQQQILTGNLPQPQGTTVSKDIYVHVAPEDPPTPGQVLALSGAQRKHYKIIFIKAPSQTVAQQQQILAASQPVEEKTLIYVLVNKQQPSEAVLQQIAAQTQHSKPEVYFIKYKAKQANGAAQGFNIASGAQSFAQGQSNLGEPILSGESTSSLFSGGLPSNPGPKYGPPGYQKRSTKKEEEK